MTDPMDQSPQGFEELKPAFQRFINDAREGYGLSDGSIIACTLNYSIGMLIAAGHAQAALDTLDALRAEVRKRL